MADLSNKTPVLLASEIPSFVFIDSIEHELDVYFEMTWNQTLYALYSPVQ